MPLRDLRLLSDVLEHQAAKRPGRIAVGDGARSLTYAELWNHARRLASWLRQQGLRRGDRAVILLENTVESAVAVYGTALAGGVFAVVHPQTKQDKLRFVLSDCGARFLIAEHRLAGVFRPAISGLPDLTAVLTVDRGDAEAAVAGPDPAESKLEHDLADALARTDPEPRPCPNIPVDLASLIYTSGSTGEPKGVMMTHQAMVFTCGSLVQYLRLDDSHRILCALPLAFDYGLYQILMSVRAGSTVLLAKDFVFPAPIIKRIQEERFQLFRINPFGRVHTGVS